MILMAIRVRWKVKYGDRDMQINCSITSRLQPTLIVSIVLYARCEVARLGRWNVGCKGWERREIEEIYYFFLT